MALYNLGTTRQMVAQNLGIQNTNNVYDFDSTTPVTLSQVNMFINDTIRENTSNWDYTFLENTKAYNFFNVTSGVQGLVLYGSAGVGPYPVTGSIWPYPANVMTYSNLAQNSVQDSANNFSGITFTGFDASNNMYSGVVSTSGSVTYNNVFSGISNIYQMDDDCAKIEGIFLQASANQQTGYGIPLSELTYHDFAMIYPIGVVAVSGTPYQYAKLPGLGPDNGVVITMAPYPTPNFSGNSFIVDYMKKHVDLVADTDTQNVIPSQFQQIIVLGTMEKIVSTYIQNDPRINMYNKQKNDLIIDMKQWDFNQANIARSFKLGPRNGMYGGSGRSMFDTSQNIYVP